MDFCGSSETTLVLTCQCYRVTVHDLTVPLQFERCVALQCIVNNIVTGLSFKESFLVKNQWLSPTTQIFKGYFHSLL